MTPPKGSILVTGTNGGLGSAIVEQIIKKQDIASNYLGLYTVRKAATATKLQSVLARAPKDHKHETLDLDLSTLASVRRFAADLNARVANGELPKIRALVLNAGFQEHTELTISDDGYDLTWQVNYLANLLLVLLLLQSMDEEHGRIIFIASFTHDIENKYNDSIGAYNDPRFPTIFPDVDDLAKGRWSTPQEDNTSKAGMRRYGASKLCVVMLLVDLAQRLAKDPKLSNISVLGLDPGAMPTDIARRNNFIVRFVIMQVVLPILATGASYISPNGMIRTPALSAEHTLRLCFDVEAPKGEALYVDGTKDAPIAKDAKDEAKRRLLWDYGIKAAKIQDGESALVNWK